MNVKTHKYLALLNTIYKKFTRYKISFLLLMLILYSLVSFLIFPEESRNLTNSGSFISTENIIKPFNSPLDGKNVSDTLSEIKSSYVTTLYESLLIISDQDFVDNGFNGSGTEEAPYLIENYQIVVPHLDYALQIKLTTKHFIVQNCFFEARQNGLFISNTAQGTAQVINNTFVKCSEYGLFVDYSPSCKIINNTCTDNDIGIQLVASGSSNITLNSCENNSRYGISISISTYTTISNNTLINDGLFIYEANIANYLKYFIYNNSINSKAFGYCTNIENQTLDSVDYGQMFLLNCINITVLNIDVSNSDLGVLILDCINTTLRNIHSNNNWNGIQIANSETITLTNCSVKNGRFTAINAQNVNNLTFYNNTINSEAIGLILSHVDDSNISNNLFLSSVDYGVYVTYGSDNNIFYGNIFAGNKGGNIQASDYGINNMWYEESLFLGNCWSDWNEVGNYSIEGSAGSFDAYPTKYDDLLPPTINSVECNYLVESWRVAIKSRIVDDVKVDTVICTYKIQGGIWTSSIGNYLGASLYVNNILEQQLPYQTTIQYYFEINDTSGKVSLSKIFEYTVDSSKPSTPQLEEIHPETVPSMYNLTWSSSKDLDGYIVSYIVEESDVTSPWEGSAAYARWEINNVTYLTIQLYSVILGADPIQFFRVRAMDEDGLLSDWSNIVFYDIPLDQDSDNMPDDWENLYGLDTLIDDSAFDLDADGLTNLQEYLQGTDPGNNDSDTDSMPDGWEVANDLNPLIDDASSDLDTDGLTNLEEYQNSTNPNDADSDDDGLTDGAEISAYNTDPNDADSDDDGLTDGAEINTYSTDPNNSDSDDDGLTDGDEVNLYFTSPTNPDTDEDGRSDGWEVQNDQNPISFDNYLNTFEIILYYAVLPLIVLSLVTLVVVSLIRSRKRKLLLRRTMNNFQGKHDTLLMKEFKDIFTNISTIFDLTSSIDRINQFTISLSDLTRDLMLIYSKKRSFSKDKISTYESVLKSTRTFLEDKFRCTILDTINLITAENLDAFTNDLISGLAHNWSEKGFKPVLFSYVQLLSFLSNAKELGNNISASREILAELPSTFSSSITSLVEDKITIVHETSKNTEKVIEELTPIISNSTINNQKLDRLAKIRDTYSRITTSRLKPLVEFETEKSLKAWLNIYSLEYPHRIEGDEIIFEARVEGAELREDMTTAIDDLLEQFSNWEETGTGKKK